MTARYPLVLNGSTVQETQPGDTIQLPSALGVASGGTGETTATAAFNALAPSQTGNSGKYLTTDGTNTSWATVSGGGISTGKAIAMAMIFGF